MSDMQQTELMFTEKIPIERIHGSMLSAAIGDALGWSQEQNSGRLGPPLEPLDEIKFQPWRRRGGYRFESYEEHIKAGEYSDDTQLLIATARSILQGKQWSTILFKQEIPLWLLYERGGGGATKRAARAWLAGTHPWKQHQKPLQSYFNAGGNGVAMRILPHVLKHGQTQEQLVRDVMRNGILTHGHPRALLGAIVYARAAWWIAYTSEPLPLGGAIQEILDNRTEWELLPSNAENRNSGWLDAANQAFPHGYEVEWKKTVDEICDGLITLQRSIQEQGALLNDHAILDRIGCFGKMNGSGVVAALAVLYLFSVYANDPVTGLQTIAFAKSADTDTLASMLGGLFGLTHGIEWIPMSLRHVQDHELIGSIAGRLVQPIDQGEEQSIHLWSEDDTRRAVEILQTNQYNSLSLGILGNAKVESRQTLKPLTRNLLEVEEWCLRTDLGQTLYITQTQRVPSSASLKKKEPSTPSKKPETSDSTRTHQVLSEETVEVSLQVLRKVLNSSPESPETMLNSISDQWSNLADADCQIIISRLEKFLHNVKT